MENAVDYAASRLFGGKETPQRVAPSKQGRNGGTASNGGVPVFDLGQRSPVPVLHRPMRADSLVAMQAVIEQCHAMNAAAAMLGRLIRDNDLPFIPRGIETARFAVGDLMHNIDEAMHAHHSVMDRG